MHTIACLKIRALSAVSTMCLFYNSYRDSMSHTVTQSIHFLLLRGCQGLCVVATDDLLRARAGIDLASVLELLPELSKLAHKHNVTFAV